MKSVGIVPHELSVCMLIDIVHGNISYGSVASESFRNIDLFSLLSTQMTKLFFYTKKTNIVGKRGFNLTLTSDTIFISCVFFHDTPN